MSSDLKRKRTESESEASEWSASERLQLLQEVLSQCPEGDKLSFSARSNKIQWEAVHIGDHTVAECQEMFNILMKKVRKFRTLAEVVDDAKDMEENPAKFSRSPKSKKIKHPDEPVRPLTAYFRYMKDHRQKVKKENPNLSGREVNNILTERWNSLSSSKLHKYQARYRKEWEEYKEAYAKFLEKHPELTQKHNKPVPPRPVHLYIAAKLPAFLKKHPDMKQGQARDKLRARYTSLKPDKKRKWIQRAFNAVPEYEEQVQEYKLIHPDYQPPQKKVLLKHEEKLMNGELGIAETGRFPGAPAKPPRSPYMMFVQKKMQEMEGTQKDKFIELGKQWSALSERKRLKYQKKYEKCKSQYLEEVERFKQTLSEDDLAHYLKTLKSRNKANSRADE